MIDELVISIPSLSEDQWNDLLFGLKEFKVPIFKGPNLEEVIKGSTLSEIKPLSYEDLLGRSSVPPKRELLEGSVKDQVVLVTGAGGSIGGELTKKIINLNPTSLVLMDHSEHALYEIERNLKLVNSQR